MYLCRILPLIAIMLVPLLSLCSDGGKDTLTLKNRYGERIAILTQTKNPKFLKKRRGVLDQRLYLRTYKKYAYESSRMRKNFGVFQSVQGDSIYLKSLDEHSELMAFAIKDLRFIQIYNGRGTPVVGKGLIGVSLLLTAAGFSELGNNPGIGGMVVLVGITGAVTGTFIKGMRYKMDQWEVVP